MITINGRVLENQFTSSQWSTANPVLKDRVQGFDSTVKAFKMGDGVTAWNDLPYYYSTAIVTETELDYPLHTSLPITLNMAVTYPQYGKFPKFVIIVMSGGSAGLDVTEQAFIDRGVVFPSTSLKINVVDDGTGQTEQAIKIVIYK